MKKHLIFILTLILSMNNGFSQTFDWVVAPLGFVSEFNDNGEAFEFGFNSSSDSIDVDPTSDLMVIPGMTWYIQKYDSDGSRLWSNVLSVDSVDYFEIRMLKACKDGGVFVTGKFKGAVDFDFLGQGWVETSSEHFVNREDIFLFKLDKDGQIEWFTNIVVSGWYPSADIYPMPNDGVYVVLDDQGNSIINESTNPVYLNASPDVTNIYVARFDAGGEYHSASKLSLDRPSFDETFEMKIQVDKFNNQFWQVNHADVLSYIGPNDQEPTLIGLDSSNSMASFLKIDPSGSLSKSVTFDDHILAGFHYMEPFELAEDRLVMTLDLIGTYDYDLSSDTFVLSSINPSKPNTVILSLNNDLSFHNAVLNPNQNMSTQLCVNGSDIYLRLMTSESGDIDFGASEFEVEGSDESPVTSIVKLNSLLQYDKSFSYRMDNKHIHTGKAWTVNDQLDYFSSGIIMATYDFDPSSTLSIVEVPNTTGAFVRYLLKLNASDIQYGVTENNTKHPIQVYPNPSSTGWTVVLDQTFETAEIKLFDISGKQVYSQNFSSNSVILINPPLSPGVYLGSVTTDKGTQAIKLIRE